MDFTVSTLSVAGLFVGVAATLTMDLLSGQARKIGLIAGADGRWVGRWYLGMAQGRFVHRNIATYPEQAHEDRAALIGHYIIGVALAIVYILGARWLGLTPSRAIVAIGYGLGTCVFPWFMVLPALGFGVFGLRGPDEMKLFRTSVLNHLFYGFGLWWACWVLGLG